MTSDPGTGVALVLHDALMRSLGVTLTGTADLEQLAADCAEDGRYAFLHVAAPLEVAKGSGSRSTPSSSSRTAVSTYDDRPWLARYGDQPADYDIEFDDALSMFRAGLARDPSGDALQYFDGVLSRRELDELSDGLAGGLLANGFAPGDRLAVLGRRTRGTARRQARLQAGMYLVGTVYNFCTYHASLTLQGQGRRTPAMAAGITNRCWSVGEVLRHPVPPARWQPPKRRGRRSRALQQLIDRWCT